jgi:hypothetical protein
VACGDCVCDWNKSKVNATLLFREARAGAARVFLVFIESVRAACLMYAIHETRGNANSDDVIVRVQEKNKSLVAWLNSLHTSSVRGVDPLTLIIELFACVSHLATKNNPRRRKQKPLSFK